MRDIHYLFLDIDGVLQTPALGDFVELEHEPTLKSWLQANPGVHLVLTSSHREDLTLAQLKGRFDPLVSQRIVGMTSVTAMGRAYGGRQREIEAWMSTSAEVPNARWAALDDEPLLFDQPCPRLVPVHPWSGLLPEHLDQAGSILTGQLLSRPEDRAAEQHRVQQVAPSSAKSGHKSTAPALASVAEKLEHLKAVQPSSPTRKTPSAAQPAQGWFSRTLAKLGL